ncbi:MAG: hypothetical protein HS115_13385 [Spirochaetales bacterium]|nr:hypothetical protein [Spirochaetales bacterium]
MKTTFKWGIPVLVLSLLLSCTLIPGLQSEAEDSGKKNLLMTGLLLALSDSSSSGCKTVSTSSGFMGSCTIPAANQGTGLNYCNETYIGNATNAETACTAGGNGTWSATARCCGDSAKSFCLQKTNNSHFTLAFIGKTLTQQECETDYASDSSVVSTTIPTIPATAAP